MNIPIPENEPERLAALHEYRILDTPGEPAYDELSELAAQICECPVAFINFIDDTRNWLKAAYGLPQGHSVPRDITMCSTTLCANDLVVVPDCSKDPRFREYPIVIGEPFVRFYCGMPLINPEGYALGTMCIVDFQPREVTFEQSQALRRLSRQVMTQLELRRSVIELTRAREAASAEKARTDALLSNILPRNIARELAEHGHVTPRFHDAVSILFADFEGFTMLVEHMEPKALVDQLDCFFSEFDDIIARYGLEKLKMIGDAYMCAGGLPAPSRTHAVDTCLAALAMEDCMAKANRRREQLHLPRWELRIGIHTGPVIAGIVGKTRFTYDVWGDAVNIAARMETSATAGRINVSEATFQHAKDYFDFEQRGSIEVKNKGSLSMFYLQRIKAPFARDPAGIFPNGEFLRRLGRPAATTAPYGEFASGARAP